MGESSAVIYFPMTAEEIKQAKKQLQHIRGQAKPKKTAKNLETIEMADGKTISFEISAD